LKKTFIALAAACAAGAAMAQSSVTLFGVVDVGIAHLTGTDVSRTGVSTGGANISRLGFRGTEDLGGGLMFNRRATVSLSGVNWGELRLGRDDAATFLNTLIFDPFLTNGVGGNNAFIMQGAPIQISNAISYFLPANLGGFYGQLQYAPGEQPSNAANSKQGNYWGVRGGWRGKALNVAAASGELRGATGADDVRANNAGISYDFGLARPSLLWATEKKNGVKITAWELGVTAPVGPGELRAEVSRYDTSNSNADWSKVAIGYGYNFSKRTQVYGTVAHVSNSDGSQKSIGVQGLAAPGTSLGGTSNGYEVGIRHFF